MPPISRATASRSQRNGAACTEEAVTRASVILATLVPHSVLDQQDAGEDRGKTGGPRGGQVLAEEHMTDQRDADDAETFPDGIGDRHGNDAQRDAEQDERQADQEQRQGAGEPWWRQPTSARPSRDLDGDGREQNQPMKRHVAHGRSRRWTSRVRRRDSQAIVRV